MTTTTWEATLTLETAPAVSSEEAVCLRRLRAGELAATAAFVRRFYPQVQQLIAWHTPCQAEPDDLAEQVLLRILRRLRFYFGAIPLEDWVSRQACAACRAELRNDRQRQDDLLTPDDLSEEEHRLLACAAHQHSTLSPEDQETIRAILEELILELAPVDRFIVRMQDIEGMELPDVCGMLGWPAWRARFRSWLARRRLRRRLTQLIRRG